MMSMDSNNGMGAGPGPRLPRLPRPRSPRGKAAALIAACALVAGGTFAVTDALSGQGASAPAATAAVGAAASGPTGQAAVLNAALSDTSLASFTSSGTSSPQSTAAERAALRRVRRALARLRRLGGMYGQYTFETKQGPRTLAFERGTITSVNGDDVSARATDGATFTWELTGTSVVREDGERTSASALAAGQQIFAAGLVSGGTRDARLIVIRAATTAPKPA